MKTNPIQIGLLVGALLFWIVALIVVSLVFSIVVLWRKTQALNAAAAIGLRTVAITCFR
jgi:hypothetical protein